jgi:hypothetical protein
MGFESICGLRIELLVSHEIWVSYRAKRRPLTY